ncbi:MAG: peroxiredoxin-like family protein [Cyclobacteriaceae bacterium]
MMKHFFITLLFTGITSLLFSQSEVAVEPTAISPLLIGEKIPNITLSDVSGKKINLFELVSQKPSVIVFYRGGWCPYCNLHLAELQAIEADIIKAGYQIIAISPDSPESLQVSVAKNKLNYLLLSDNRTEAARGFGLAFQAPERYAEMLGKASADQNRSVLPVPAVFVVNTTGEILFEHINPDYKKRLKGSLLLAVLNELK